MGEPLKFIVCAVCKAMTDAVTAVPMWFVNDTTVTPVRGFICGACALVRHEAGADAGLVDTRTGGDNGAG